MPNPPPTPPFVKPVDHHTYELVKDVRVVPYVRIYKPDSVIGFFIRPTFGMKYDEATQWAERQLTYEHVTYPKSWQGAPDYKLVKSKGAVWDFLTAWIPSLSGECESVVVTRD